MEKQVYCFVGSECQIGDIKLEKFGTEVSFTKAEALNALEGGAQLCPKEQFDFSEEEVKAYPFPAFRDKAPESFKAKHKAALHAVVAHLTELREVSNG